MEVQDINHSMVIKMETDGIPRVMEMAVMVSLPAMVQVLGLAKEDKGIVTITILFYQFDLGFDISSWGVIMYCFALITTKNIPSLKMLQEHHRLA